MKKSLSLPLDNINAFSQFGINIIVISIVLNFEGTTYVWIKSQGTVNHGGQLNLDMTNNMHT